MKRLFFVLLCLVLFHCKKSPKDLGYDLELLRIKSLKNADAYENIIEFNQIIDSWNTLQGKEKADSFFLKLSQDYQLNLTEETLLENTNEIFQDTAYLEIQNPLLDNKKIEIPFVNFRKTAQTIDIQAPLIYFKKFDLSDFSKKKKQIIGKILVLELNENEFYEYIEQSKTSGILGLLIIVKEGNAVPCYQYHGDYKIPILGLSQDDGFFLIESLKKYPKQFVRILIKQKIIKQKTKSWKWEKDFGKSQNIFIVCNWKPQSCNKGILSSVTSSLILLDIAKTFQNFEWNCNYNLIFVWSEGDLFHVKKDSNKDIYIHLENLSDFMGWYYPKKDHKKWDFVIHQLRVYEKNIEIKSHNQDYVKPIIPVEQQKIINTDSEGIEWLHKEMVLRSLGMLALTIYLLSIS
ncbi:MAG: hypothetical protein KatS3mg035_1258 [Bacteroidia bacterium]|nr:MAG: hypothetical protein KatS3mg035_1258 [Bacteroidia bacterium]